jgi:hypothetical protein
MADLTLREALASNRLEAFVRQEEARGVELTHGFALAWQAANDKARELGWIV